MSNIQRQAIVSLAAITGAQLVHVVLSPAPVQSSDCLQWASEGINHALQREPCRKAADPLDGRNYWENDVWADAQPQAAVTPTVVTPQPVARTQAPAVQADSIPLPVPIAPPALPSAPPQATASTPPRSNVVVVNSEAECDGLFETTGKGCVVRQPAPSSQGGNVAL